MKIKRWIGVLLCMLLCVGALPTVALAAPATGDGSEGNPYCISTAEELKAFRDDVNRGESYEGKHIILTGDINLDGNEASQWTPIGTASNKAFKGEFNGNGHIIEGLYMNGKVYQAGLFGYVSAGAKVENLSVSGTVTSTNQCVGGIVGTNKGTVFNCHSSVTVTGGTQTGGVAGNNGGTVGGCSYSGAVTGNGSYTGGIVGYSEGEIIRCYNTGTVEGVNYTGGIVGSNGKSLESCYNTGDISGQKGIGGLAGFNFGSTSYSYSTGNVNGTSEVGFLFGTKQGEVINSYFLSDTYVEEEKGGTCKNSDQFASGEVAYLLNNGVTDGTQTFYQTCGKGLPVFSGETVYQVKNYQCPGDTVGTAIYSNTNENITGEHSFTQETVDAQYLKSAATCTEAAVYYKSCAFCGQSSPTETFIDGNPAGHSGGTATCTGKAVCEVCGEEYGKINAANHTNLVKTEAKPATHMAEGNIEYWYCDGCDKYFSDKAGTKEIALANTVIPKLTEHTADGTGWHSDETNHWNTCECGEKLNEAAHIFKWVIDKEATATEKGSKHEKCTVCGYEKAAVEIPATGTPSDIDTSSPQTGDDSNIALWIAVMFAAGAVLTGTAVYSCKKKYRK